MKYVLFVYQLKFMYFIYCYEKILISMVWCKHTNTSYTQNHIQRERDLARVQIVRNFINCLDCKSAAHEIFAWKPFFLRVFLERHRHRCNSNSHHHYIRIPERSYAIGGSHKLASQVTAQKKYCEDSVCEYWRFQVRQTRLVSSFDRNRHDDRKSSPVVSGVDMRIAYFIFEIIFSDCWNFSLFVSIFSVISY